MCFFRKARGGPEHGDLGLVWEGGCVYKVGEATEDQILGRSPKIIHTHTKHVEYSLSPGMWHQLNEVS